MNYYKVLELTDRQCSKEEIKKSYYRLSKQWHPDRHTAEADKLSATKKFQEISEAYAVLSDDRKRANYNMNQCINDHARGGGGGGSGWNGSGMPMNINVNQFFKTFMGDRQFSQMFGDVGIKKTVLIQHVKVKLLTFYLGGTISFNVNMKIKCNECSGTGSDNPHKITICPVCNGKGKIQTEKMFSPGFTTTQLALCHGPGCNGNGKIVPVENQCKKCKGNRHIIGPSFIEFTVEKGSNYGTYLIENKGDHLDGGLRGDIKLVLVPDENDKKDYCFERRNDDLIIEKRLTLREALLGFNFMIRHLDPNNEWIEFNSVKPIESGTVKMLPGYGMPKFNSQMKGAMIILFLVEFPKVIDPEFRARLEVALPVDDGGSGSWNEGNKPNKITNINMDNVYSLEEIESNNYKQRK